MRELSIRPTVAFSTLPPWEAKYKGALAYQTSDEMLYYASDSAWSPVGSVAAAPVGDSGSVQFNSEGALGGAANILVDNGDLALALSSSPVTPATDTVKLFGRRLANRMLPAAVGPSGFDSVMQPSLWRNKVGRWNPSGNQAAYVPMVDGFMHVTSIGTSIACPVATTNVYTRSRRLGYRSSSSPATFAGHSMPSQQFALGNGAGLGGFFYSVRFGQNHDIDMPQSRTFVGLSPATSTPNNVDPSTAVNAVGLVKNASDSNFRVVCNGGAVQPSIDLGANFPATTRGQDLYELTLYSPPNLNGVVHYRVERCGTQYVAEGTFGPGTPGVTAPSNITTLAHRAWVGNNIYSAPAQIDIASVYVETDY